MLRMLLTPKWIAAHLFVLSAVIVFAVLGSWQLSRLGDRRERNAAVERQAALDPVDLTNESTDPARDAYRRATARGTYDPSGEVVLRSRAYQGHPGHHVLTPLVMEDGRAILVDRGWVPFEMNRGPVDAAAPPDGVVEVSGVLLAPDPAARFGPQDPAEGELRAVFRADPLRLASQLDYPVEATYLLLEMQRPGQAGTLPMVQELPQLDEGPHLSYAVQWLLFIPTALAVYGALIYRETRRRRPPRASPRSDRDEPAAHPT